MLRKVSGHETENFKVRYAKLPYIQEKCFVGRRRFFCAPSWYQMSRPSSLADLSVLPCIGSRFRMLKGGQQGAIQIFEHQHDRRRLFDCSLSRVCTAAQLSDGTNQIGRRELLQSLAVVTASSTLALGSNLAAAEVDMESPLQHVDNDIVIRPSAYIVTFVALP